MTELVVRHVDGVVGTITRSAGKASFSYYDEWRARPHPTPLSTSMPVSARVHPQHVIEPFLWNMLPDNDRVLERWGRQFAVTTSHPYGLIEHVGADLPGAMQVVTTETAARDPLDNRTVDWLTDQDVAELLTAVRADNTAWIKPGVAGQWSLAGAQPKIALLFDAEHGWGRPYGATPTTHILKPAAEGLDDHDLNEHLCLAAARRLGLTTASSEVKWFGEERAIVVSRYDRVGTERVHQEDLCQALGVHPALKYQNEGGPTPSDIASLFRAVMSSRTASDATNRFVEALLFNWLIGGTDAHAKNYSLLLAGADVRLAPLYDIASAFPYDDVYFPKAKSAMKIGAHYKITSVTQNSWKELAAQTQTDSGWVIARGQELAAQVVEAFHEASADPAVSAFESTLPELLVRRVETHAAECNTKLA